jgi:hypothetical protein
MGIDVEAAHFATTLNRHFPNGGAHGLPSPRDIAGQANVDRNQARWHFHFRRG